jgi:hypothetical protein
VCAADLRFDRPRLSTLAFDCTNSQGSSPERASTLDAPCGEWGMLSFAVDVVEAWLPACAVRSFAGWMMTVLVLVSICTGFIGAPLT